MPPAKRTVKAPKGKSKPDNSSTLYVTSTPAVPPSMPIAPTVSIASPVSMVATTAAILDSSIPAAESSVPKAVSDDHGGADTSVTGDLLMDFGIDSLEELEEEDGEGEEVDELDENQDTPAIGATDMSPVALSLLNAMVNSPFTPGHSKSITADLHADNPCHTNSMRDMAKYWVTSSDNLVILRLPCLVDMGVPGVKIGKYFDLFEDKLSDDTFKKLRAVFGFRSLPDSEEYPPAVLKAASEVQKLLYMFHSKCETSRKNEPLPQRNITPFFKVDISEDCFQYLMKMEPIFAPAPAPTIDVVDLTIDVVDLTSDDDDDSATAIFSSPSKLCAKVASKSSAASAALASRWTGGFTLKKWSSPDDTTSLYSHYIGDRKHLWDSRFNVLEICNCNGLIVQPNEWESKLIHMTPVTVDFVLKLWEIPANPMCKGSRIYQLILRRIQIHPSNNLSHNIMKPSFLKGKRHVEEDEEDKSEGPSTPTKLAKKVKKVKRADLGDDVTMENVD